MRKGLRNLSNTLFPFTFSLYFQSNKLQSKKKNQERKEETYRKKPCWEDGELKNTEKPLSYPLSLLTLSKTPAFSGLLRRLSAVGGMFQLFSSLLVSSQPHLSLRYVVQPWRRWSWVILEKALLWWVICGLPPRSVGVVTRLGLWLGMLTTGLGPTLFSLL